jgi:hypothetical protein
VKSTVEKVSIRSISDKFPTFEAETCCIDIAFQLPFKLYNYKGQKKKQQALRPNGQHQPLACGDVHFFEKKKYNKHY